MDASKRRAAVSDPMKRATDKDGCRVGVRSNGDASDREQSRPDETDLAEGGMESVATALQ